MTAFDKLLPKSPYDMTVAELRKVLTSLNIPTSKKSKRVELIAAIEAHEAELPTHDSPAQ